MVRKNSLAVLFIISTLLGACAPQTAQPVPIEPQTAQPVPSESAPPVEVVPATETPLVSILWVGYRDERFGVGLAFPCWWVFTPMSPDGIGGSMTLRSFDEEYARAHSTKGNWNNNIVPEGAFALDIGVFEEIDPTLSTTEAWSGMTDPSMSTIVSSEEQVIGQNQATVIQMQNANNSDEPPFTMYLYRIAPDKILMVSPLYQDRLNTDDIQGILTSLALTPDQPITVPTVRPHEPLIAAACTGN